jgi:uncharacterized protein YbjT (DUF2867 family)
MTYTQKIAVIGATGQVGFPLCRELLQLGHQTVAISRAPSADNRFRLDALQAAGADLVFQADLGNVESLGRALVGCDTVVVATRANAHIVQELEPRILQAAQAAGVRRFVPDEFGTHSKGLPDGVGTLFDAKKVFQRRLMASKMEWTLMFTGGIFDYFLPNLRFFEQITTFGDVHCTFPTHALADIAAVSALAITDSRTVNKAVQMYANVVTQAQLVRTLERLWPKHHFERVHVSSETIIELKEHGDPHKVSAKAGAEPDRERHGINYANFVLGQMACLADPDTLNANDLYPSHPYVRPAHALADAGFVFGASVSKRANSTLSG